MRSKRITRLEHSKKTIALLVALLLLLTVGVGTTVAFLIDQTDTVVNTFTPATVSGEIEESFKNDVKENVAIKNIGDVNAYIRATIVVTWKNGNDVYPKAPVAGIDYTITYGSGWNRGSDGYYYYPTAVKPGASTTNLIDICQSVPGKTPEGYHLSVEVLSSAIQAEPAKAVTDAWSVNVNADGTISK